jgi:hypothetical protein
MRLRNSAWAGCSVLLALLVLAAQGGHEQPTLGQAARVVGLVISFRDGRPPHRECLPYRVGMTGIQALQASQYGDRLTLQDFGGALGPALCRIDGVGCALEQGCLSCPDDAGRASFWGYYYRDGEGWQFSPLGAGARQVLPSTVEGWAWSLVEGDASSQAPPDLGIVDVCGLPRVRLPVIIG